MIRVGQRLHDERIRKGLSLEDVAKATKIRPSFLSAIEKGDYHKLPSPAYAQGFVSNYAQFLGFSKRESLALFRREFDEEKEFRVLPEGLAKEKSFPKHRIRIQKTVLIVIALLLVVAGFLVYQYRYAFIAPPLKLTSPMDTTLNATEVDVSGKTDPSAIVSVDNEPVAVDEDGKFEKQITVFPGKSVITVTARNRFGKEAIVQKSIIVK